jgi:hypothetical protein
MRHNRLANLATYDALPQPPPPVLNPGHYVGCPLALVQGFTPEQRTLQWLVYLLAFQQAQIEARPSLLERDLLGTWN